MVTKKLHISSLEEFKITKVKDKEVYFTYKNTKYVIFSANVSIALYERIKTENGYDISLVSACIKKIDINNLIVDTISKNKPKNLTYSNINKPYFIKGLTLLGLVTSVYSNEYDNLKKKLQDIDNKIAELVLSKDTLTEDWLKTNNSTEEHVLKPINKN